MSELLACKILIVDDLQENLLAANRILSELPSVEIVHAKSGEEALQQSLRERFALVLLDVNMPGIDGYEVAKLLSTNPTTKCIPIVMITALGRTQDAVIKAYDVGAVDYIVKPIESAILLNKVKQFVSLYRAHERSKESLQALAGLREESDKILNTAGEGIIKTDSQGLIQYANRQAQMILHSPLSQLLGSHLDNWFIDNLQPNCFDTLYTFSLREPKKDRHRLDAQTKDGSAMPVEAICTFIAEIGSTKPNMVMLFRDISDRINSQNRLLHLANYDQLTGLTSRAYFQESLQRSIARSKRTNISTTLFIVNLDNFKKVNNAFGYDVGDEVLKLVALRLRKDFQEADTIARLGADEFALITEDTTIRNDDVGILAQKLVAKLAEPYKLTFDGPTINIAVECSVGVALSQEGRIDANTLIQSADTALYNAKDAGRNTHRTAFDEIPDRLKHKATIKAALQKALDNEEITLHYQPLISHPEKRVCGFEALARWQASGDDTTELSPSTFIPIAEESDLIHQLGESILRQACRQLEAWQTRFKDESIRLNVNISTQQLAAQNFTELVKEITNAYTFPHNLLVFEVNEPEVLNSTNALRNLNKLKQEGYGLALDGFGTSQSSLTKLQELPIDTIKIDRSFICGINSSRKKISIVNAIIVLAHSFHIKVVAVGVEQHSELELLSHLGCDYVQGFYFSEALPVNNASTFISTLAGQKFTDVKKLTAPDINTTLHKQ